MERFDAIVVDAGAVGMLCVAQASQLGYRVLLLDNDKKSGQKILVFGGSRYSFTNMCVEPAAYPNQNPHLYKSTLTRYTQWDFIELVSKYGITQYEKTFGQLLCDDSAGQIVSLLFAEYEEGDVQARLCSEILNVERDGQDYRLQMNGEALMTKELVITSSGLSMLGPGASPFGYRVAEWFGLKVPPTRAGLVPSTLYKPLLKQLQALSDISVPSAITTEDDTLFREDLLFIHRGLSGPAILQISSYWQPDGFVTVNLLPDCNLEDFLNEQRSTHPDQGLKNTLAMQLLKRLAGCLQQLGQVPDVTLKQLNIRDQQTLVETLTAWRVQPNGTEGYRTTGVTFDGVDINELSSRTMGARKASDLYFIDGVMDIAG